MTPYDLIRLALRDAGVNGQGQSPSDEDMNDAFSHLNMMLGLWNRKRWLIWHLRDIYALSNGSAVYMVGPGEAFDCPRPNRIEAAFARYVTSYSGLTFGSAIGSFAIGVDGIADVEAQGVDSPIRVLPAREDYNFAQMKGLIGPPRSVFYDAAWPVGRLYFDRFPQSGQYELHVSVKEELKQFASLTETINLPGEYHEAILWNMAKRLRFSYQMKPDPELNRMASDALATIREANTQIPYMRTPSFLSSRRRRMNVLVG